MLDLIYGISQQPFMYHFGLMMTVVLILESLFRAGQLRWGFAALTYCTIGLWYFVDPAYRPENYAERFTVEELNAAYLQVIIFLVAFRLAIEFFAPRTPSSILREFDPRVVANQKTAKVVILIWLILFTIGVARMDFRVIQALFPLNGRWESLWARPRFGGTTDFLVSIGMYCYQLTCAMFGLIAVSTASRRVRRTMMFMIALTWPMFLLGGTRHHVLAVGMPSILAILIINRWSRTKQIVFLGTVAVCLNFAFLVVLEYRDSGFAEYFETNFTVKETEKERKHLGLNMTQELCYLMRYQSQGRLEIEWGGNYLAHAINFIPRVIWPGKPFPGGDFSVVRVGFHKGQVAATISHGIVGQGITNFGPFFGPLAPVILLTILCSWGCRLPSRGNRFLRVSLVFVLLGKIPNMGRDITLFALWPIIFGGVALIIVERNTRSRLSSHNTGNTNHPNPLLLKQQRS